MLIIWPMHSSVTPHHALNSNRREGGFPVDAVMPELQQALAGHGRAILTASPGSGKTTRVPLALLGLLPQAENGLMPNPLPGKILVLEPRRLAARAAARYMAGLLGEAVGQRVGYRVRLESKVSAATRVELLTEGMFTRRLLADPELFGVSCVIFDEFHERSLQADLGLALCLECMEAFRPDLRLLVMSATLDAAELSRFLGGCPILEAEGRTWPVDVRYARRDLAVTPAAGVAEVAETTARAVREALREEAGSILVFLPGRAEIGRTAALLENVPEHTHVHSLYGDLPPSEQDAAIGPPLPGCRKVVLATDIAQTSLTIEGVRIVIDAGLSRGLRFEPSTGLSRLTTSRVTQDAADQRAGRAGRLEAGVCLRLWPEGEPLLPKARPEIAEADLTQLYLDSLTWGSKPDRLPWLTPPPKAALLNAAESLLALGAALPASHESGGLTLTPHGETLARLPLHPRLAHMVLCAAEKGVDASGGCSCAATRQPAGPATSQLASLAASLAALVSERDPLRKHAAGEVSADIRLRLPLLRRPENARLREAAEQIYRLCGIAGAFTLPRAEDEAYCGALLSLAWPERIAQRRGRGSFRLARGQGAQLPGHDTLADEPWLVAVNLGTGAGSGGNRRVYLAAPICLDDVLRLHGEALRREDDVHWSARDEAVVCRSVKRLGALIIEETALPPSAELNERIRSALLQGIVSLGLECLPWTVEARQLQARVAMLRALQAGAQPEELALGESARRASGPGPGHPTAQGPGHPTAQGAGQICEQICGQTSERHCGEGAHWPDMSDAALLAGLSDSGAHLSGWLCPWLEGITRRSQFAALDMYAVLRSLLPWPLSERLEVEAPRRIALPSGSAAELDYLPVLTGEPPVLAVKLQEMFGQTDTPRVGGGRIPVMLHLLSPAGRPLQVTGDLRHFWMHGYKQVRAEMRGRYPKHPWPEDALTAVPTGKTKKRMAATPGK